jgi:hypothetical protein
MWEGALVEAEFGEINKAEKHNFEAGAVGNTKNQTQEYTRI